MHSFQMIYTTTARDNPTASIHVLTYFFMCLHVRLDKGGDHYLLFGVIFLLFKSISYYMILSKVAIITKPGLVRNKSTKKKVTHTCLKNRKKCITLT